MIAKGTIKTNIKFVAVLQVPMIVINDKVKPKKRLPQSPINNFAGLKLYLKKPSVDPANITDKTAGKIRLYDSE